MNKGNECRKNSKDLAGKAIRALDCAADVFLKTVFIAAALLGIYIITDSIQVFYGADAAKSYRYEWNAADENRTDGLMNDAVGRVCIDNTPIDFPVMQGEDNAEYLNKAPNGEYSLSGSVFLDADNDSGFSDDYSILYAHHMTGDAMFGSLDRFEEGGFFGEHLCGSLETEDQTYELAVYAFLVCDASDPEIFSLGKPLQERKEFIKAHAVHLNEQAEEESLIALTTCRTPGGTDRTVLICSIDR